MSGEPTSSSSSSLDRLHSSLFNATLRNWQTNNCQITPDNLMFPIFIVEDDDAEQPIASMPGVSRYGLNKLKPVLEKLISLGLSSVLLFGVAESLEKDSVGSNADSEANPVVRALPRLRKWFPSLTLACDVCLCPWTNHGHCGLLHDDGRLDNGRSIARLAEVALKYAVAGAHIVAPSDMMDGRIGAIKAALRQHQLDGHVALLSYAAKFASSFYGPFRDAAKSAPSFGDRKCYQLPCGAIGLAKRAAARDVSEGADLLMVKPGLAYLDVVRQLKDLHPDHPMFVYQVSGEYAMLKAAADRGALDLQPALTEALNCMRRAGADVVITYFTPTLLEWMALQNQRRL